MKGTTSAVSTFKPFLVESNLKNGNIFRVNDLGGLRREQVELVLEKLPIYFNVIKDNGSKYDFINEPLEVYASGCILSVYPPRHRLIGSTTMSFEPLEIVSKMHMDHIVDTGYPKHCQIRSCVHFDPAIFGVTGWKETTGGHEDLELDMYVYPLSRSDELVVKPLSFSKDRVRKLLIMIASGEKQLSEQKLDDWRDLIMNAVNSMRYSYENPDVDEDYPVRVYYQPCWKQIDEAGKDNTKLIDALEYLRVSIEHE